jgi:carbon monoxide dehydrogenase subunit G
MQIANSQTVAAGQSTTWEALMDPEVLKACVPGCESIDKTAEQSYRVAIHAKIGPVSAKFQGKLALTDLDPPHTYTVTFEGQGGAMGFGKGRAQVKLQAVDGGTELRYKVDATVGGKLAQIGARLIDGAAMKLADDFFAKFGAYLAEREAMLREDAPMVIALGPGDVHPLCLNSEQDGRKQAKGWLIAAAVSLLAAALAAIYVYYRTSAF